MSCSLPRWMDSRQILCVYARRCTSWFYHLLQVLQPETQPDATGKLEYEETNWTKMRLASIRIQNLHKNCAKYITFKSYHVFIDFTW
mmetsp:Transcript_39063/g.117410  ORF Transcript_39063/g.117410 Transcript_39063/m.117410 type:complete len:87 (-) Transcript_39063:1044-1304(-)